MSALSGTQSQRRFPVPERPAGKIEPGPVPRSTRHYRVSVDIRGGDASGKLVERVEAADPPEALRIVLGSLPGVVVGRCEVVPDRRGRDD